VNNPKIVHRLAPDIYYDNKTMLAIYDAQADELGQYEDEIYQIFLNNLVSYCDLDGLRRFEALFFIQADEENESIEYRRERIRLKFAVRLPFTKISVKRMLEAAFGAGNVDFEPIYNEYKLRVGIDTPIDGLYEQTIKELRDEIIPANIILEAIQYEPYLHRYLKKHYNHGEMRQFTQGELSQYANSEHTGE